LKPIVAESLVVEQILMRKLELLISVLPVLVQLTHAGYASVSATGRTSFRRLRGGGSAGTVEESRSTLSCTQGKTAGQQMVQLPIFTAAVLRMHMLMHIRVAVHWMAPWLRLSKRCERSICQVRMLPLHYPRGTGKLNIKGRASDQDKGI
jgi:hypothetical protein